MPNSVPLPEPAPVKPFTPADLTGVVTACTQALELIAYYKPPSDKWSREEARESVAAALLTPQGYLPEPLQLLAKAWLDGVGADYAAGQNFGECRRVLRAIKAGAEALQREAATVEAPTSGERREKPPV